MKGSCEYIEEAPDSQQRVVLKLGGWT